MTVVYFKAPATVISVNMTNFVEGENVSLSCDVFGVPYPSVSWINVANMEKLNESAIWILPNISRNYHGAYECRAALVQNKPNAPIHRVENKVEFLERQFHSEKLSFVYKKETEHSLEISLSICVFYRRVFNLEMQNFSLENHNMMTARQPFC